MKKKNILKAVIALTIILILTLPCSAIENDILNDDRQIINKPMLSVNIEMMGSSESGIDWWPMYRHDLNHSGYSTSDTPDTDILLWKYVMGGGLNGAPAVVDGRVYIGCGGGYVYCLNESDGVLIWKTVTNADHTPTSPTVAYGRVYIGFPYDKFYCLDAENGSILWIYDGGGSLCSSPVVTDGKVFVTLYDTLYCLDAMDGSEIWSSDFDYGHYSQLVVIDDKIFSNSQDKMYCLNASDGSEIWNYTAGQSMMGPAVVDGRVYAGARDMNVYCLDAEDGSLIWKYATWNIILYSSPAVAYGRVYIGSMDWFANCLDASDGSLIWRYNVGQSIASSPAVADGKVFITGHCFNAFDGSLLWQFDGSDDSVIANGKIFSIDNMNLYCYSRHDNDIAITSIDSPADGPAGNFTPEITVWNYGLNNETDVPVNLEIARFEFPDWVVEYNNTTHIDIDAGEASAVAFPEWTPENLYGTTGSITYRIMACTQLPDDNPDNDCNSVSIILDFIHDVGVKVITKPIRFGDDWIHFDDGIFYNCIGSWYPNTYEAAIRITPTELEDYENWLLTAVRFYHAEAMLHSGNIKIYDAGNLTGPGELMVSEPYTVKGEGWFEIPLSNQNQIFLSDIDKDIWVSVEIRYGAFEWPMGVDDGPAVDGKGDWIYWDNRWFELQSVGLEYNWNLWAKVEEIPQWPPGNYPIEAIVKNYGSFNESDFNVNATIYTMDDEMFYHNDTVVDTTLYLHNETAVAFNDVIFSNFDDGIYKLEITTELTDDGNFQNNRKTKIFNIIYSDEIPPDITLEKERIGFRKYKFTADVCDPEPSSGINRTEFYLDGKLQDTFPENDSVTNKSYEWIWQGFGNHTVTAVTYDNAGNNASATETVPSLLEQFLEWILSIFGRILKMENTYI